MNLHWCIDGFRAIHEVDNTKTFGNFTVSGDNNHLVYSIPRASDTANGLLLYLSTDEDYSCEIASAVQFYSQTSNISAKVILLQIVEGKSTCHH